MPELMRNYINCERQCEIPDGKVLSDIIRPRHRWIDVVDCPNEGCGRTFLVMDEDTEVKND
jgi:hypothetical protein